MIKAITFDLWDTVFIDDSDEPKRRAMGLSPKPMERRSIVEEYLSRHDPIERALVNAAYDTVDEAFRHVWYHQNITWTVAERLGILFKGLKREVPAADFSGIVRRHEEMELAIMPDLAEGIADALKELHGQFRLAVISDAIFSPGRVLRGILEHYGLLSLFDSFVFSDEIGCSKPNPLVFRQVSKDLGVSPEEIVHIGDREQKDIEGPHLVNAKAILTTVVRDRRLKPTKAEAVCSSYRDLPAIVKSLNN